MWIPQPGRLDVRPQVPGLGAQLCLEAWRRAPLGELAEAVGGDMVAAPERKVRLVGGAHDVAEVRQPQRLREVLGVRRVRPEALHHQLWNFRRFGCG